MIIGATGGRIKVADPAAKLARLMNDEFGTDIHSAAIAMLFNKSWDELSLYAHALHAQLEAVNK